jgi:outer membrane porin, OprD family
MTTMPRASSHAQSRGGFFIFLVLFALCGTGEHLSWGQESVLDRGPAPESVHELNSPLDIPFLPLAPIPWAFTALQDSIRESLKPQMETLPPFLRDTQLALNLRLYYFYRDNEVTPPRSDNEAFTIGGSLAYQSGWLANILRIGLEGFGSQKLYGPESRDGTLLLLPGQNSYAVLGRAYGELKYAEYTATLYRQYIDTPYVNQQDNRMTPNTFEAYRIN